MHHHWLLVTILELMEKQFTLLIISCGPVDLLWGKHWIIKQGVQEIFAEAAIGGSGRAPPFPWFSGQGIQRATLRQQTCCGFVRKMRWVVRSMRVGCISNNLFLIPLFLLGVLFKFYHHGFKLMKKNINEKKFKKNEYLYLCMLVYPLRQGKAWAYPALNLACAKKVSLSISPAHLGAQFCQIWLCYHPLLPPLFFPSLICSQIIFSEENAILKCLVDDYLAVEFHPHKFYMTASHTFHHQPYKNNGSLWKTLFLTNAKIHIDFVFIQTLSRLFLTQTAGGGLQFQNPHRKGGLPVDYRRFMVEGSLGGGEDILDHEVVVFGWGVLHCKKNSLNFECQLQAVE
ncbi:putative signal peptide protein [Puccinia sorghi]|uniref:Putative signal peptide protein n=1 Tax=Puccinia sorghi TaxID=27349 RepID=A0A0L6UNU8_9BASI|nr:putative signal peptide protein [Puccinia sorghi]